MIDKCNKIIDMKRVAILISDGKRFEDKPINIDYADDTGMEDDAICIEMDDGGIVSILDGEIESYGFCLAQRGK